MKKHSYIRAALSVAIVGVSALAANIALAAAPEPVALWNGDFGTLERGGYTIVPNGNVVAPNGKDITISANVGVLVNWSDGADFSDGNITVIVRYSNWTETDNNGALATLWAGGKTVEENKDIVGPYTAASTGVLGNIWNGAADSKGTTQSKTLPTDGVFAVDYSGNTAPKGSTTYIQNDSGTFEEACTGNGALFTTTTDIKGLAIGGSRNAYNNLKAQTDMKIEAFAIFNKRLTTSEIAAAVAEYFPQEYVPQEGDIISFNFAQYGTGNDNGLATETQLTLNGEIPVKAWSQKAAVNSTIESSVIYRPSTDETIASSASMAYSASGAQNYVHQTDPALDGAHKYMYDSLARLNDGDDTQNINIANIPFVKYDLYLYFSGHKDVDGGTFRSFTVNGTQYTVNSSGAPVSGTAAWGSRNNAIPILGTNAVKFSGLMDGDFVLSGSVKGAGVCAVQIVNKSSGKLSLVLDGDKTWSELLAGQEEPSEDTAIEVKVTGDWTLTLDRGLVCARVSFVGEKVSITSSSRQLITDSIAKFNAAKLTDSISYIYKVASGYDAPEGLRNIIKGASKKQRFIFKGVGESGVTLDYGEAKLNTTLGTHIVFDGGKHTLQMRNAYDQAGSGLKFGANATANNPTIRVMGGAYLTFKAKDPCGWESGQTNANGIIRVDDESTLEMIPTAGTCYWAQQIYLEPGATLAINDNGTNFRVNGGTGSGATAQLYVPDSVSDMTDKPATITQLGTGGLYVNGEGTANMAVYVGKNSKLYFDCNVGPQGGGNQVTKYGAGILEAKDGTISNIPTWQLSGGTLVYDGELKHVNFNNGALVGNEKVTITEYMQVKESGESLAKNVVFNGTNFVFGTGANIKLIADGFEYRPSETISATGSGMIEVKDLTIDTNAGLPSAVGLDVNSDDGILRLVSTEWETARTLCGGTLTAPSGKVKRTIYLGEKAYKTKVLFDTTAKTIKVFKPGLLFFVQ